MYIKITDDGNAVKVNSEWGRRERDIALKNMPKTQVDAYESATGFMATHPEFHSVVFCTDLLDGDLEEMEETDDD